MIFKMCIFLQNWNNVDEGIEDTCHDIEYLRSLVNNVVTSTTTTTTTTTLPFQSSQTEIPTTATQTVSSYSHIELRSVQLTQIFL